MDLVRYADSGGFEFDVDRPEMYRYRDYLIEAFNKDKPYDLFIKEQLAGDEYVAERPDKVELLVLFLGAVPRIDLAGAELIESLHTTLAARGITLRLADAHGEVRDALGRMGFDHVYGPLESGQTVDAVVSSWLSGAGVRGG